MCKKLEKKLMFNGVKIGIPIPSGNPKFVKGWRGNAARSAEAKNEPVPVQAALIGSITDRWELVSLALVVCRLRAAVRRMVANFSFFVLFFRFSILIMSPAAPACAVDNGA